MFKVYLYLPYNTSSLDEVVVLESSDTTDHDLSIIRNKLCHLQTLNPIVNGKHHMSFNIFNDVINLLKEDGATDQDIENFNKFKKLTYTNSENYRLTVHLVIKDDYMG